MMSIKRSVCLLLALCMGLGLLAACGEGGAQPTVDPANCLHEKHDPETTCCLACNKKIDHYFKDGSCRYCGKTTEFLWFSVSTQPELMETLKSGGHANKGTVERMTYETFAYNINALTGEEKMIEKEAFVYLPYGYDPAEKYNVLILLHGSTDQAGYWLAQAPYSAGDSTFVGTGNYTRELLDYMMGEGLCEKCIVVTPSLYNDHDNYEEENSVAAPLLGHEFVEYLLPAVLEKYSTYAGTLDEVIANREHFAYAGFSMGSMTGFASIMSYCLPYFAYIGSFSAGARDGADTVLAALNGEYRDYDIKYWFSGVGDQDSLAKGAHETYKTLTGGCDRLIPEQNCALVDVYNANHTYECALTSLYNALPKFFR